MALLDRLGDELGALVLVAGYGVEAITLDDLVVLFRTLDEYKIGVSLNRTMNQS